MTCYSQVIDLQPVTALLLGVGGDPFAFRLNITDDDGVPVDVTSWEFAGTVSTGRRRLPFEFYPDAAGVSVLLRGDDTSLIPLSSPLLPGLPGWPFDIAARQPTAGEGSTILRGHMKMAARQTDPLRNDPDLRPSDAEPVPA